MTQLHMHKQGATSLQQHAPGCLQRGSQAITCKPLHMLHRREWRTSTIQVRFKPSLVRQCSFCSRFYTIMRTMSLLIRSSGEPAGASVSAL